MIVARRSQCSWVIHSIDDGVGFRAYDSCPSCIGFDSWNEMPHMLLADYVEGGRIKYINNLESPLETVRHLSIWYWYLLSVRDQLRP